jgi:hemerythrin-like domain-containing protein
VLRDASLIPLSHQHHNGLALCVLTRRAMQRDAGPESLRALAQRIHDRYELELVNHFQIEEETLFPAAAAHPLVPRLIDEHRQLERLVAAITAAPSVSAIEEFCALLTQHIRTEENELFAFLQTDLSRETLDRLGQLIDVQAVRICL